MATDPVGTLNKLLIAYQRNVAKAACQEYAARTALIW